MRLPTNADLDSVDPAVPKQVKCRPDLSAQAQLDLWIRESRPLTGGRAQRVEVDDENSLPPTSDEEP